MSRSKHCKSLLFIATFSAQRQAAVALSAAWHSAWLQLRTQAKAKSTFIFPVGPIGG